MSLFLISAATNILCFCSCPFFFALVFDFEALKADGGGGGSLEDE